MRVHEYFGCGGQRGNPTAFRCRLAREPISLPPAPLPSVFWPPSPLSFWSTPVFSQLSQTPRLFSSQIVSLSSTQASQVSPSVPPNHPQFFRPRARLPPSSRALPMTRQLQDQLKLTLCSCSAFSATVQALELLRPQSLASSSDRPSFLPFSPHGRRRLS